MWPKSYKDYPTDTFLVKQQVEPSHGIIGCEMHDLNGWGTSYHQERKRPKEKRDSKDDSDNSPKKNF